MLDPALFMASVQFSIFLTIIISGYLFVLLINLLLVPIADPGRGLGVPMILIFYPAAFSPNNHHQVHGKIHPV
jgi:hypothetical protein